MKSFTLSVCVIILGLIVGCGEKQIPSKEATTVDSYYETYRQNRLSDLEKYIMNQGTLEGYGEADVYGALMDWNLGQGRYATLCVLIDGRTKLYTSTGAKEINIKHQNVANEVSRYLTACTRLHSFSQRYVNAKLPEEGHYRFYLKTNSGVSIGEGHMDDVKELKSPWAALFKQANDVITEVRATYNDFYAE